MKGVSPVVATVLLIAVAVIAAIGVWYWVGAYTGKPSVSVDQKAFSIESCNGSSALIRNTGALAISADASIFNSAGTQVGVLGISVGGGISSGGIKPVDIYDELDNITNLGSGVYNIIDSDYPQQTFSCV